jgi:hypothetical protein
MSSNFALLRHTVLPPKFSAGKLTFIENKFNYCRNGRGAYKVVQKYIVPKNLLTLVHKIMFLKYGAK